MPIARPTAPFTAWMNANCTATERASITGLVQDLNTYGLARGDPDLIRLGQGVAVASARVPGLEIDISVVPQRISTGLLRARTMWFGVVVIAAGPAVLRGRLLVLKGWTESPALSLVAAQAELVALASAAFA